MFHYRILIYFLFVFTLNGYSQIPGFRERHKFIVPADSGNINITLYGSSFFKNNEYFNPIELGYTLLGYNFEPTVNMQFSDKFRMEAGAGMLKYSGNDGIYRVEPIFRLQYQPFTQFQIILGTLFGAQDHNLIEPLYRWEQHFSAPLENGLQFIYGTDRLKADLWLNWEKFIQHGDPFQEELTVGFSGDYKLIKKDKGFEVAVPLQTLFKHKGGQINSVDTPLVTFANWATGLKFRVNFHHRFFRFWDAEFYYLGFSDLSPQKLQQFKNGYALFPKTKLGFGNFSTEIGYFYGARFISPMGERLFHSATIPVSDIVYPRNNLVTVKLHFEQEIVTGIMLGTYFELYSNLKNKQSDYTYGLHILFNHDFFLLKF